MDGFGGGGGIATAAAHAIDGTACGSSGSGGGGGRKRLNAERLPLGGSAVVQNGSGGHEEAPACSLPSATPPHNSFQGILPVITPLPLLPGRRSAGEVHEGDRQSVLSEDSTGITGMGGLDNASADNFSLPASFPGGGGTNLLANLASGSGHEGATPVAASLASRSPRRPPLSANAFSSIAASAGSGGAFVAAATHAGRPLSPVLGTQTTSTTHTQLVPGMPTPTLAGTSPSPSPTWPSPPSPPDLRGVMGSPPMTPLDRETRWRRRFAELDDQVEAHCRAYEALLHGCCSGASDSSVAFGEAPVPATAPPPTTLQSSREAATLTEGGPRALSGRFDAASSPTLAAAPPLFDASSNTAPVDFLSADSIGQAAAATSIAAARWRVGSASSRAGAGEPRNSLQDQGGEALALRSASCAASVSAVREKALQEACKENEFAQDAADRSLASVRESAETLLAFHALRVATAGDRGSSGGCGDVCASHGDGGRRRGGDASRAALAGMRS